MTNEECPTCQYFRDNTDRPHGGCFILGYTQYISKCPCLLCLVKSMCKDECSDRSYLCGTIFTEAYKKNENRNR
jgi:hypothetical protein